MKNRIYINNGQKFSEEYSEGTLTEKYNDEKMKAVRLPHALNATALYGLSNLPKKVYFTVIKMMLVYGMKPLQAVELYNKYIGDWGGNSN